MRRSWTWAAASRVGSSHVRSDQRLQDASSCFRHGATDREFFVAIVADGAGSASLGGEGAALVCRVINRAARGYLAAHASLPSAAAIEGWIDAARDRIYLAAQRRDKEPRDFAATLVCAMSDGESAVFAHIGDGCAVVREQATGQWTAPTWPDQGEYASMTSFVTDQPVAKLRISTFDEAIDVVAVFTDGIERLVLNMAEKRPSERFFSAMAQPVLDSIVPGGRDRQLSQALESYLDSPPVLARTDDDKTLVIAVCR